MVVAQALSAGMQTAPGDEVHSLHGYFLRPTSPGAKTTHAVSRLRDGRSFSTRQVVSVVKGKEVFRMTCSFHAPEDGDDYQLPVGPGIPPPREVAGVEAPFFEIRTRPTPSESGRHLPVHAPLLVPHQRAPGPRPIVHASS